MLVSIGVGVEPKKCVSECTECREMIKHDTTIIIGNPITLITQILTQTLTQ